MLEMIIIDNMLEGYTLNWLKKLMEVESFTFHLCNMMSSPLVEH